MNAQAPQRLLDWLWASDADDPEWITVNGAHIPLDKEGEPKGKVGEKIKAEENKPHEERQDASSGEEISLTGEELGAWKDVKELRKKAVAYYKANFQGKTVHRDDMGDIRFTGKGRDEMEAYSADPDKLLMMPALGNIIETGEKGEEEPRNHPRKDGIVAFVPVTKKVRLKGEEREVEVLLGKDENGNLYYDLYLDGRRQKRKKKVPGGNPEPDPGPAGDSTTGIAPVLELNIRIKPFPVKGQDATRAFRIEEATPMSDKLTLDAAPSRRRRDENGFLHVDGCHITREQVAPYYGREIPGWEALGLDPERLYHAYRPAEELAKAAPTINGLPILWGHSPESADAPQLDRRIGSMGTDAAFNAPYLDNSLIFTVAEAIDAIEDGRERELSLSYRYEPDFTPGTFEGQPYDFVMRNLRGNHLALVPEGRAGASCCVADAAPDAKEGEGWITTENGKHIHFKKDGEIDKGNIGQKDWDSPSAQGARRDKVENAMREIANGKAEATVPGLRNDLEQYGGTNDVTIIKGDAKKGLVHIEQRHGAASVAPVLEAVANGKITRFVEGNKTVHIDKDGYRAVLSLEEHGKKKTWLLTGYDIWEDTKKEPTGDSGKVSARHAATHDGPILSRPDMGAMDSFRQRIEQLLEKSNHQTRKGGFMSTLKKLFRGANDADPGNTETQAPEGQSAPEAPQAGPAPADKPEDKDKGMDEGMKAAMDKCGLDAEDPTAQAAFAEGVKYAEALMREKGEREKLDSEHEAEGLEKAEDGEASAAPAAASMRCPA